MINQLRADAFVLSRSATLWACLLTCTAAAALYTWLQHSLATGALGPASANGVQGLSDVLLTSLLGPLLYGVIVARPIETRTLHASLLASGRGAFLAAKTVAAPLVVSALAVPYGIATLVGRATGEEFAPVLPTTFPLLLAQTGELSAGDSGRILAITVVTGMLMAAKFAVCLPLAIWVRRPLVVMAIGFVWGFVGDLLGGRLAEVDGLDALVDLTPYSPQRLPLPDSTAGDLGVTVAVSLIFIAAMGLVAWILFRRADVR